MTDFSFSSCEKIPYLTYQPGKKQEDVQEIAQEVITEVWLHREKIGTLISSPQDLASLVAGYVLAEDKLPPAETIERIICQPGRAEVVTQRQKMTSKAEKDSPFTVAATQLCAYGNLLDSLSTAHHTSHGVHEGALVQAGKVLAYAEDVGRHNVLDRLRGAIALEKLDVTQAVLVFSGRVPQSVITKVYHMGVRFLASRALPTSLGVKLAQQYGLSLVCGLRPDTFKVFAHAERIIW